MSPGFHNRRLEKTENGDTVSYLYDGGVSVQEYDAEGSLKTYLVRAGGYGGGIGDVVYTENADGTGREYFLYNATGTTSALTDDDGAVTSTSCYTAWGIETATVGTSENVRKFSTKERSELLGIDYFGFRCYDPDLGRFLTRDPSGYPDGPNNYLYCMNSPVNKIDPLGLKSSLWDDIRTTFSSLEGYASVAAGFYQGVGHGAKNIAVGVGEAVVQAGANAVDTVGAAYEIGQRSQAEFIESITGKPQQVPRVEAVGNFGQSVERGTLNTAKYYWDTSANIATAGIYDQVMTATDMAKGDISVEEGSKRVGVGGVFQAGGAALSYLRRGKLGSSQENTTQTAVETTKANNRPTKPGKDIVGTEHSAMRPTQDSIHPDRVVYYEQLIDQGVELKPIQVTTNSDGGISILDGHHRYVASQRKGVPIRTYEESPNGPRGMDNWKDIVYEKFEIDE